MRHLLSTFYMLVDRRDGMNATITTVRLTGNVDHSLSKSVTFGSEILNSTVDR